MKELINNIYRMTNPELIGLAKNRFLPEAVQVAVVKTGYDRAAHYLCENAGLKPKTKEVLWDLGGYVKKCTLITYGHYMENPEKYVELYNQHADTMRSRSPWRLSRTFLTSSRWWGHGQFEMTAKTGCPAEIIEDIYKKDVISKRAPDGSNTQRWDYGSSPDYVERDIISNPNTPTDLIVGISASSPNEPNRNSAMRVMANRG